MASKRTAGLASQVESYLKLSEKPKPLQLLYRTSSAWPYRAPPCAEKSDHIDVGVLDSSFNPPQAAHFALATKDKPAKFQTENGRKQYDAILLLFSVKNADKGTGTSRDASTTQRLHMMELMAQDLERYADANVAVGMVEEPLMYSKSTLIHEFVKTKFEGQHPKVRLHWLVGFDTLQRFFQVKYYPSLVFFQNACETFFKKERTTFICARRGKDSLPNRDSGADAQQSEAEVENDLLQSDLVKPWVDDGSVVMTDLDTAVQSISSTAIRKLISDEKLRPEELSSKLESMTSTNVARYLADPETQIYAKSEQR